MKSVKLVVMALYGLLVLNHSIMQAQQKKYLTREDYKSWSNFGASDLSADGKWVYYNILHQETDTLFLVDKIKNKSTLIITDRAGLATKGAGINFVIQENKQKIELNKSNIEKYKLKVASSLVELAIQVK